jgi:EAL domain-containing protein (putative c-di-GMP-specific phosphodiesterase class I)
VLSELELPWREHEASSSYMAQLGPGPLDTVAKPLRQRLPASELWHGKALFLPERFHLRAGDFARVTSLGEWAAWVHSNWLVDLLRRGRIQPFYQPIVHARDPVRIFGHESLVRGRGEDGEMHGGGAIMTAAAESGLLTYVDCLARSRAIEGYIHDTEGPGQLFVNFSPAALADDPRRCLDSAHRAVTEAGIPPEGVVFEVVEADHVRDEEDLARLLRGYRDLGFRVALDDLGAGYGSLSRLETLHPDYVKLDRSLVQGVHRDGLKGSIASKMLEAAREHGIRTIAEGVEEPGELAWARDHGADYVQGFLVGYPQPPTRAEAH